MGSYSCLIGNVYRSRESELCKSYVASFPAYFSIILLPPVACCQLCNLELDESSSTRVV